MPCEMCGASGTLYHVEVEGSRLTTCEQCKQYGKVLGSVQDKQAAPRIRKPVQEEVEEEEYIKEGYAVLIKEAREQAGLKQEALAKKLHEKESVIHAIETGRREPPIELAKKLERTLGIRLIEKGVVEAPVQQHGQGSGLTIGDMIKLSRK